MVKYRFKGQNSKNKISPAFNFFNRLALVCQNSSFLSSPSLLLLFSLAFFSLSTIYHSFSFPVFTLPLTYSQAEVTRLTFLQHGCQTQLQHLSCFTLPQSFSFLSFHLPLPTPSLLAWVKKKEAEISPRPCKGDWYQIAVKMEMPIKLTALPQPSSFPFPF